MSPLAHPRRTHRGVLRVAAPRDHHHALQVALLGIAVPGAHIDYVTSLSRHPVLTIRYTARNRPAARNLTTVIHATVNRLTVPDASSTQVGTLTVNSQEYPGFTYTVAALTDAEHDEFTVGTQIAQGEAGPSTIRPRPTRSPR